MVNQMQYMLLDNCSEFNEHSFLSVLGGFPSSLLPIFSSFSLPTSLF
jgi:hypothetical protein